MHLEDSAAERVNTDLQTLPSAECGEVCGYSHTDAEACTKVCVLEQHIVTAPEHVHQMHACFNSITVLQLLPGEGIECFLTCVNSVLHRLVVTAPAGLDLIGKWLDPTH